MNEQEYNGSAGTALPRKSDFIDATEDLAGRSRGNPVEVVIDSMVMCNDVTNQDGKKESGVFAARLKAADENGRVLGHRLRMNATKRKMMTAAAHTIVAKNWAGMRLRLYQTVDSDRKTGGKTYCNAVGVDCLDMKSAQWMRYYDFQQPKGQKHVRAAGLLDDDGPMPTKDTP